MTEVSDWLPIVFLPFAMGVFLLGRDARREVVRRWAESNNLTLVRRLPSWYRLSPFWLSLILGKQRVEYWLVKDAFGMEHRVWLKLGGVFVGSFSDQVIEEWES